MTEDKTTAVVPDGWETGSIGDFLGLSEDKVRFIDLKIALKDAVKQYRREAAITQNQLAYLIDSSQSRIAKIEAGDPSVSIELMVRALFAMGADMEDIAIAISPNLQKDIQNLIAGSEEMKIVMGRTNERITKLEYSVYQLRTQIPVQADFAIVSPDSTPLPYGEFQWSAPKATSYQQH